MHHIPNVSYIISELSRVLTLGGNMLLREPIVSMGDWTLPRRGLTKRERGIPEKILDGILENSGLRIKSKHYCFFSLTPHVLKFIKKGSYNDKMVVYFDYLLSNIFSFNLTYHYKTQFKRIKPTAVFYILEKHENS
jgi:hypothetical protein